VTDDWLDDRQFVKDNEDYEEAIPLDMLDDADVQNSAFFKRKRKLSGKPLYFVNSTSKFLVDSIEDEESDNEQMRHFKNELNDDEEEMLPLKIDGSLVRRVKKVDKPEVKDEEEEPIDSMEVEEESEKQEDAEENLSQLSPVDRLLREKELLNEVEKRINSHAKALQLNPQTEVNRLGDLIKLSSGLRVHSAVREESQLIATARTTQILLDIIPGYHIRPLTAEEKGQKMKKETRQLAAFEEHLLQHYVNFLKLLENQAKSKLPFVYK
jgi:nucleolar complex protein 3